MAGWDPFNVTEDADLGLRLTRSGYQVDTITHPTYENAPETLSVWLPQRTRWFKGWLQSWLVHMRAPKVLARDLGLFGFVVMQILFLGMVTSALAHSIFVASILYFVWWLAVEGRLPDQYAAILAIDIFNIVGGYAAFLVLGRRTLSKAERKGFWKVVVLTPLYWLAMSAAAWRALLHLVLKPHHWEKTPHPRSRNLHAVEPTVPGVDSIDALASRPF